MITIRPFERTNEDHRLAVGIFNAVWVGQEETVEAWQKRDERRANTLKWGRFFAEKRGSVENLRHLESRLEPGTFHLADWADHACRVAEQGIDIRSVVDLKTDPDRDRKLYELGWAIAQDIPSSEPSVRDSFEEFQKVWQRPTRVQDAWSVALGQGEYVGMTEFWSNQTDPGLF